MASETYLFHGNLRFLCHRVSFRNGIRYHPILHLCHSFSGHNIFLGAIAVKVMGETGTEPVSGTSFIVLLILVILFKYVLGLPKEETAIMAIIGTTVFGGAISGIRGGLVGAAAGIAIGGTIAMLLKTATDSLMESAPTLEQLSERTRLRRSPGADGLVAQGTAPSKTSDKGSLPQSSEKRLSRALDLSTKEPPKAALCAKK